MKFKKIETDKILGLSAMFISLCTLIVFLYQTNLIRQQQYMSVYPHLSLENYGTYTSNYKYVLKNDGVGPAIIKSVMVKTKDGKNYDDIASYVNASVAQMKDSTLNFYFTNVHKGRLVPANNKIDIILNNDKKMRTAAILHKILHKKGLNIEIEYESIYGERWEITNNSKFPVKK